MARAVGEGQLAAVAECPATQVPAGEEAGVSSRVSSGTLKMSHRSTKAGPQVVLGSPRRPAVQPDGVVLVAEDGGSLTASDVTSASASRQSPPALPWPRTIDAGLLITSASTGCHSSATSAPSPSPLTAPGTAPLSKTQTCHCRKSAMTVSCSAVVRT